VFAGAIPVSDHSIDNSWIRREIFSGVGKERLKWIFAHDSLDKNVRGIQEESFLSARGDHFILIVDKDNKNLEAVYGREMRTCAANGKLAFAGRATMPEIIDYFWA